MTQLLLSKIKAADLAPLVRIQEQGMGAYPWLQVEAVPITEAEQQQLTPIEIRLLRERTLLMNEATVWARAIYPLLLLAERESIQAWVQVELSAQYKHFSIAGIADSVVGYCLEIDGIHRAAFIPEKIGFAIAAA